MADGCVVTVHHTEDDALTLQLAQEALLSKYKQGRSKRRRLKTQARKRTALFQKLHPHSDDYDILNEDFFHELEKQSVDLAIGADNISGLHKQRVVRKLGQLVRRHTIVAQDEADLLEQVNLLDQEQQDTETETASSVDLTIPSSIPEETQRPDSLEKASSIASSSGPAVVNAQDVESTDYAFVNFHADTKPQTSSSAAGEDGHEIPHQLTLKTVGTKRAKNPQRKRDRAKGKLIRSPSYVRNSLKRSRSEVIRQDDKVLENALKEAGIVEEEKAEIAWDVLYECQRGINRNFGPNALLPFDPAAWCTSDMRPSPYTPALFPLPTPSWRFRSPEFRIDKRGKVDSEGWQYAFSFSQGHNPQKKWHSKQLFGRAFVRRRRWVRPRHKLPVNPVKALIPSHMRYDPSIASTIDDQAEESYLTRNSAFANREIPTGEVEPDPKEDEFNGVLTVHSACALLPLSEERKGELLGWEQELDAHSPFLAWSQIKREVLRVGEGKGRSDESLHRIWRQAVVEINRHRVDRIMIRCKLDREKLKMWQFWFGAIVEEKTPDHDHSLPANDPKAVQKMDMKPPDLEDVWDLVERKLDHLLKLFEYQSTIADFLQLVLQQHHIQHSHHRFIAYDNSLYTVPSCIRPERKGRQLSKDADISAAASAFRPRVQFYSQVQRLRAFYITTEGGRS